MRVHKLSFLPLNMLMSQVIKEPTHILGNSEFCIDLMLTSQPNIMDSGVHPSLYCNCNHQISYAKFDLKVFYPPSCERTVWHFSWANSDHIKKLLTYLIENLCLIILMSMSRFLFLKKQLWISCLILFSMN